MFFFKNLQNIIFFHLTLLFSLSVFAIDYSGIYEGAICKTIDSCNRINSSNDIVTQNSILFTLKHNTNRQNITINFHELGKTFSKMNLLGNNFNGKINFKSINGRFDDNVIAIFYYNTLNDKKFYIKAFLNTDNNISVMLKDLKNENNNEDKEKIEKYKPESINTNQLNVLDLRIYDLEKDIKSLTLQIEELLFLIDDLNNKIDNMDTNTSINSELKLLLTELETRLILLELNK